MGNPATAIRSQAGAGLYNNNAGMARDVRPLAADPAGDWANSDAARALGGARSDSEFEGANVKHETSGVLFNRAPEAGREQDTMERTQIAAKVWGDPHYENDILVDAKTGKVLRNLEGIDADDAARLYRDRQVDVDGDGKIDYRIKDNDWTHTGRIGEAYMLFKGDNLNVSGLYGESPWNPDGPTVIVLTQVTTSAGYQVVYDKEDPSNVRINFRDGSGPNGDGWQTLKVDGKLDVTLKDGTTIGAAVDERGQQGISVTSKIGHSIYVVIEGGWRDAQAQTVHVDGVGMGRKDAADGKDLYQAGKVSGWQDDGSGFRNATDGILAWLATHDRAAERDPTTGKSLNDWKTMEDFGERAWNVSNDPLFGIPTSLYKGKVWVTKTPPQGARV